MRFLPLTRDRALNKHTLLARSPHRRTRNFSGIHVCGKPARHFNHSPGMLARVMYFGPPVIRMRCTSTTAKKVFFSERTCHENCASDAADDDDDVDDADGANNGISDDDDDYVQYRVTVRCYCNCCARCRVFYAHVRWPAWQFIKK